MINIKIEKVTLNIGVGGPGDKLSKAKKLLGWEPKISIEEGIDELIRVFND